jgi:hypothetical protein
MQAADVILKLTPLIEGLVNREWTEIDRILDKEGEIKVTLQALLNNRETALGEQAEKSNLLRVNISFSERFTASAECELVSHPELPLSYSGPCHTPDLSLAGNDEEANEIEQDANLSSPGAEDAGTTPIAEALDQAATNTEQPLIRWDDDEPLDQSGWTVGGLIAKFRYCAKRSKWTHAAVSLMADQLVAIADVEKIKETIRPHIAGAQSEEQVTSEQEAVGV